MKIDKKNKKLGDHQNYTTFTLDTLSKDVESDRGAASFSLGVLCVQKKCLSKEHKIVFGKRKVATGMYYLKG
jgi:hypothetical protein